MVHSTREHRQSPRTGERPLSPSVTNAALGLKSPLCKMKSPASRLKKLGTPNKMTSPSPARRKAAEHLAEMTPQKQVVATPRSARQGSAKNYKEEEHLTVRINVYDLVWNRNDNGEAVKNAASGFENLGFGLYHSALEIWGKEIVI